MRTYPEDTDGIVRAVRSAVGLNHAEHAVQLPVDEEDNKEVVGVPELLEVSTTAFLHGEPHHDAECDGHDPACGTRSGDEVGGDECHDPLACRVGVGIDHRQLGEVDHVCADVHCRPQYYRPCCGLVEGDILVEGNEAVKRRATNERDEVTADGE